MKHLTTIIIGALFLCSTSAVKSADAVRSVHVIVALCDNEHQGIAPVPASLGNGDGPRGNLYWGALYGVKTHFKKQAEWKLLHCADGPGPYVLERCVFRHHSGRVYMVADAYRGREITRATEDFLDAAAGRNKGTIALSDRTNIGVNGSADLIAYVGHNGLMDFSISSLPERADDKKRDVIILACASRPYFRKAVTKAGAAPLLWTTNLMAPEAYTLKAALDGWVRGESDLQIRDRAAKSYAGYQKCGLAAAKRLLVTGF